MIGGYTTGRVHVINWRRVCQKQVWGQWQVITSHGYCGCNQLSLLLLHKSSAGFGDNGSTRYWPPGSPHTLVQVVIFKKGIGFLCGLKFITLNIFHEKRILTTKSMFDVANVLNISTATYVPINNYELLNIQDCSFIVVLNSLCTQSLVVSY